LRNIKGIQRLKLECGISEREISRSCQVSRSTIADYLSRVVAAKLTWTEASLLTENQIHSKMPLCRTVFSSENSIQNRIVNSAL